jgi:hypothetical protein
LGATFAFILFAKRRKRRLDTCGGVELSSDRKDTYAQMGSPVEIGSEPVVHMGGYQEERFELGNDTPTGPSVGTYGQPAAEVTTSDARYREEHSRDRIP